jgi:hypothetical protein
LLAGIGRRTERAPVITEGLVMDALAGGLQRLPFVMSLFAKLPGADRFSAERPWAGSCLLTRGSA